LAALLESVDPDRLDGHDRVLLLRAEARQLAHAQARTYRAIVAVLDAVPDQLGVEEVRAALRWTRRHADHQVTLALATVRDFPRLGAALSAGDIDASRVWSIVRGVSCVDREVARSVIDTVLVTAPDRTSGQIAASVRRLVLRHDPQAAHRRYQRALRERRVFAELTVAGTAVLAGHDLPPDRAAAAYERVDAIARATKAKGDGRTIEQLRADTFLDLLEGVGVGAVPGVRRGVVHLDLPLTTALGLTDAPGMLAGWGPICADLARQIVADNHDATWRVNLRADDGTLVDQVVVRRRPAAAEIAFVQARDQTCRAPGCRIPAQRADVDHTSDWIDGGPSTRDNLGVLCRRHHRMKHAGWQLTQPEPGVFEWRSPLGHTYRVAPEPPDDD
jgi:hypothetical protein